MSGVVLFLIILIIYIKINKIHIDIKSFFKKGFKKLDSLFGVICYCGKQGTGKTYSAVEQCHRLIENHQCDVFITNVKSFYEDLSKNNERGR